MSVWWWLVIIVVVLAVATAGWLLWRRSRRAGSVLASRLSDRGKR